MAACKRCYRPCPCCSGLATPPQSWHALLLPALALAAPALAALVLLPHRRRLHCRPLHPAPSQHLPWELGYRACVVRMQCGAGLRPAALHDSMPKGPRRRSPPLGAPLGLGRLRHALLFHCLLLLRIRHDIVVVLLVLGVKVRVEERSHDAVH